MSIPKHVQRALEEYQVTALLARDKAGDFAKSMSRRAMDLAQTGDPDAEPLASRAQTLASDLTSFAKSPLAQIPDGPVAVTIVYGPEDGTHAADLYRHFASLRNSGHTVVSVPLSLVPLVADRTRAFLFVLSPSITRWSESQESTSLRDRCHSGQCLAVPIYWRDTDFTAGYRYRGTNWLYSKMGLPRHGAVESYRSDEALASISRDIRQALGL